MQLNSQNVRRVVALAAHEGKYFCGYAIKTDDGNWTAVGRMGMSWGKMECASANDARVWLRTTSGARKFDTYAKIQELLAAIDKVPEYYRPAIEPESIDGTEPLFLPKLCKPALARMD